MTSARTKLTLLLGFAAGYVLGSKAGRQRYQQITDGFNSIRDDAKRMVDQLEDGKIGPLERGTNIWMKVARGDIADRFDKIKGTYLEVTKETKPFLIFRFSDRFTSASD